MWKRSGHLETVIPHLKKLFLQKANDSGIFPLFRPQVQDRIWRTVPIDHSRKAAILVPIVSFQGSPSLVFTTRSSKLRTHASEVSFPGGHFDASLDKSLEETAIREASEELLGDYPWWEAGGVEIIGRTTALPSIKGTPVTPILAVLPYEITSKDMFPGNPDEVDEVFFVGLEELASIESSEPSERFRSHVPVYVTPSGKRIWGLTAVVTRPLLQKLLKPVFLQTTTTTTTANSKL